MYIDYMGVSVDTILSASGSVGAVTVTPYTRVPLVSVSPRTSASTTETNDVGAYILQLYLGD